MRLTTTTTTHLLAPDNMPATTTTTHLLAPDNMPDDIDVAAIAEDACQAAFALIATRLERAGYPVTGDFMPDEVAYLDHAFATFVHAMALNNPRIAHLNDAAMYHVDNQAEPIGRVQ